MATLTKDLLNTQIENYRDHSLESSYAVFEAEVDKLTVDQLRDMLPLVQIDYGDNSRVGEDELRRVMVEATWEDFIMAVHTVTGRDISRLL